jgi:hypothetical protein
VHAPYVTLAAARWTAGMQSAARRGAALSARWHRAMATRLHAAAVQTGSLALSMMAAAADQAARS